MTTYKAILTPLEFYHFSKEENFEVGSQQAEWRKANYFLSSERLPLQTTIVGALRFYVLKVMGKLSTNDDVTDVIGARSFEYDLPKQKFGMIHALSNLYIRDEDGNLYLKTPLNLKKSTNENDTEKQDILTYYQVEKDRQGSPYFTDYSSKNWVKDYVKISEQASLELVDAPFHSFVKTRNHKANDNGNEESLFKMEMVKLSDGVHFEFFLELDERVPVRDEILFLGSQKSAFQLHLVETIEDEESQLRKRIQTALESIYEESAGSFYYLLSDAYLPDLDFDSIFSVNQKRSYRNLVTNYQDFDSQKKRFKRGKFGQLLAAGSILYDFDNQELEQGLNNPQVHQIGLNKVIKLGE